DKTERGEPTHSPDQQLRHAAVFPCCQRRRLIRGIEQKGPVSKKEPRLVFQGKGQWGTTHARQPKLASAMLCPSERDVTNRREEPRRRQRPDATYRSPRNQHPAPAFGTAQQPRPTASGFLARQKQRRQSRVVDG